MSSYEPHSESGMVVRGRDSIMMKLEQKPFKPEKRIYNTDKYKTPHEYKKWEYLSNNQPGFQVEQGTRHTRFHSGYYRKPESAIQPYKEREALEAAKAATAHASKMARMNEIIKNDKRNGNNILTGDVHESACWKQTGKLHVDDSEFVPARLKQQAIELRVSTSRFYDNTIFPPGEKRATLKKNEGFVTTKKESTVLGTGTGLPSQLIPSQGVKDNFVGHQGYDLRPYQ